MNWLWVALASFLVYGSIFIYCVAKRHWTKRGLLVGLVNLPVVALVSVAPIRGWADPDYAGFSIGLLQASQGPTVTLVAGSLFLAALASACIAVLNRLGRPMWLPTIVDGFLALNFAIILVVGLVTNPEGVRINLGEYLSVPPLATTLLLLLLFFLPLVASALWAYRRTSPAKQTGSRLRSPGSRSSRGERCEEPFR